jgi:hypothetical protein
MASLSLPHPGLKMETLVFSFRSRSLALRFQYEVVSLAHGLRSPLPVVIFSLPCYESPVLSNFIPKIPLAPGPFSSLRAMYSRGASQDLLFLWFSVVSSPLDPYP